MNGTQTQNDIEASLSIDKSPIDYLTDLSKTAIELAKDIAKGTQNSIVYNINKIKSAKDAIAETVKNTQIKNAQNRLKDALFKTEIGQPLDRSKLRDLELFGTGYLGVEHKELYSVPEFNQAMNTLMKKAGDQIGIKTTKLKFPKTNRELLQGGILGSFGGNILGGEFGKYVEAFEQMNKESFQTYRQNVLQTRKSMRSELRDADKQEQKQKYKNRHVTRAETQINKINAKRFRGELSDLITEKDRTKKTVRQELMQAHEPYMNEYENERNTDLQNKLQDYVKTKAQLEEMAKIHYTPSRKKELKQKTKEARTEYSALLDKMDSLRKKGNTNGEFNTTVEQVAKAREKLDKIDTFEAYASALLGKKERQIYSREERWNSFMEAKKSRLEDNIEEQLKTKVEIPYEVQKDITEAHLESIEENMQKRALEKAQQNQERNEAYKQANTLGNSPSDLVFTAKTKAKKSINAKIPKLDREKYLKFAGKTITEIYELGDRETALKAAIVDKDFKSRVAIEYENFIMQAGEEGIIPINKFVEVKAIESGEKAEQAKSISSLIQHLNDHFQYSGFIGGKGSANLAKQTFNNYMLSAIAGKKYTAKDGGKKTIEKTLENLATGLMKDDYATVAEKAGITARNTIHKCLASEKKKIKKEIAEIGQRIKTNGSYTGQDVLELRSKLDEIQEVRQKYGHKTHLCETPRHRMIIGLGMNVLGNYIHNADAKTLASDEGIRLANELTEAIQKTTYELDSKTELERKTRDVVLEDVYGMAMNLGQKLTPVIQEKITNLEHLKQAGIKLAEEGKVIQTTANVNGKETPVQMPAYITALQEMEKQMNGYKLGLKELGVNGQYIPGAMQELTTIFQKARPDLKVGVMQR